MDKRQIFKRELPKYMDRAGMKQIDLAKALGMSKSTVHCWITGKAFPEIDTIQRIADALGCATDDLLVERSEPDGRGTLKIISPAHAFRLDDLPALNRQPATPKEDMLMTNLWRTASIQAKRAAIAVLESMKEENIK